MARAARSARDPFGRTGRTNDGDDNTLWEILSKFPQVISRGAPDTYVPQTRTGLVLGDIGRGLSNVRSQVPNRQSNALDRLRQIMERTRSAANASKGVSNIAGGGASGGLSSIVNSMRRSSGGGSVGGMGGGNYIDSLLQEMLMGGSGGMPDMPDAAEMAQKQFAPQFELLANQRSQTSDRYNQAGQDTRAMYDALAAKIREEAIATTGQYDNTGAKMRGAYDHGISNVEGSAQRSNDEIAEIMQRLGVQAAAPDALENIAVERQRGVNNLAGNSQAFENANTQLGQNMSDYQTNTANTTGIAGANAQADWTRRLGEALAGYDNRELELTAAQQAAENQYLMQLQQMMGDYNSSMAGNQMDLLGMAIGRENDMFDRQLNQNRFGLDQLIAQGNMDNQRALRELDAAKYESDQRQQQFENSQQQQDWGINTPGQVMMEAMRLFGNHPANAQSGMREVQQAFVESDGSLQGVLQVLQNRHANSPYLNQYLALAQIYMNANS